MTPWKEVGSRGLDTWFELSAGHDDAMAEDSGGKPGGSYYVHSSLMEDYLATLEGEKAHEGYDDGYYYTWLKYALRRLGIRVREEA